MTKPKLLRTLLWTGVIAVMCLAVQPDAAAVNAPSCPATLPTADYQNGTLTGECSSASTSTGCTIKAGTTANGTQVEIQKAGSTFRSTPVSTPGTIMYAAAGDFNKDGFVDFIGASESTAADYLQVFRNDTWQNENCTTAACTAYSGAPPNWASSAYVAPPKFTAGTNLHTKYIATTTAVTYSGRYSLGVADFNGDGWPDVFEGYASSSGGFVVSTLNMYLNKGVNDASGNAQWLARYNAAAAAFTPGSVLGMQLWSVSNTQAVDFNGDGKMDILVATSANNGSIEILLNKCPGAMGANGVFVCSANPTFIDGGALITGLATIGGAADGFGTGSGGTATFSYAELTGDGYRDLVVAAPNCCTSASRRLRLFPGCATGAGCNAKGINTANPQVIAFPGGATDVLVGDFSLDGKPDLVVATDDFNYNSGNGANTFYYVNGGTSTPFGAVSQQLTSNGSAAIGGATDFDLGLVFDYDADPAHTPDMLIADGNNSAKYYILADRVSTTYLSCGDVTSGLIDLGAVTSTDAVVTSARLSPHVTAPGATFTYTYSATNNADAASPTWAPASACAAPLTPTSGVQDYCATFGTVGSKVRWKVHMCTSDITQTPALSAMGFRFNYTAASEYYRSGVTVSDGTAYVGAIRQPGDRGKLYALDAALTRGGGSSQAPPYWEVGNKLDAVMTDGQRNLYTSSGTTLLPFATSSASDATLRGLLGLGADTTPFTATTDLIDFVRGESSTVQGQGRFGYGTSTSPLTKLGSVLTSSAAVLGAPGLPAWYSYAGPSERAAVDTFVSSNTGRVPLVLFGSKDGMLHAIYSITASGNTDARNGTEAWAYIPPTVASGLYADEQSTIAANASATDGASHRKATHFPDGSPTLFDYYTGSGVKTVAMIAEGNGGRDFTVLDVTSSVTTAGTVNGPTPMWSNSAIDTVAAPGYAFTKPVAIRIKSGGAEKFLVVAGSGVDDYPAPATKGRVVAGYDLVTGTVQWKFHLKCPLTSEISGFETDDTLEPGSPVIDGYTDRVVFADACGYVYKLDPAAVSNGGWMVGLGSVPADVTADGDGAAEVALFKTAGSSLAADRPISGTIGARIDNTGRIVLYFGTGGLEAVPTTATNAFFALYADTGTIRSQYTGTCGTGGCEKFYGGVVVSPTQVLFTRTVDPVSGLIDPVTGCADDGSSVVEAYELNQGSGTAFMSDFTQTTSAAVTGALYGDAGALYFASVSGEVTRIGVPRAASAGDDSAAGHTQGSGTAQNGIGTSQGSSALTLLGWRVAL